MSLEFTVTDRESIQRGILVRGSYVVVSIHDPDMRPARVLRQSGLRDLLHLAFHDAEPSASLRLPEDIALMTAEQARQVWKFVRRWEGEVGTVVVHCEQGMSRSPAVAAALCRAYGGDERCFFSHYQPNLYVYRLMNECSGGGGRGDAQAEEAG